MKLAFVFVGGHKEVWLKDLTETYVKKLGFYFKTEIIRIKPSQLGREAADQKLKQECDAILNAVEPQDFLILCDENGKAFSSQKFSTQFVKWCESQKNRLVFVIAGAYGANLRLKERANFQLRLSEFTFNHHLAQVIVLEQVYRAVAIWKNLPYHND